eukprot:78510-Pyramimonas_sp.AAC.1
MHWADTMSYIISIIRPSLLEQLPFTSPVSSLAVPKIIARGRPKIRLLLCTRPPLGAASLKSAVFVHDLAIATFNFRTHKRWGNGTLPKLLAARARAIAKKRKEVGALLSQPWSLRSEW